MPDRLCDFLSGAFLRVAIKMLDAKAKDHLSPEVATPSDQDTATIDREHGMIPLPTMISIHFQIKKFKFSINQDHLSPSSLAGGSP